MEFDRDYSREDIEKEAVRMLVNLGQMGYAELMFFDYEMVTYIADKLECMYLQGRVQGREDCKQIANEVF